MILGLRALYRRGELVIRTGRQRTRQGEMGSGRYDDAVAVLATAYRACGRPFRSSASIQMSSNIRATAGAPNLPLTKR